MYILEYNGRPLHDPTSDINRCLSATCTVEINSNGALDFEPLFEHPLQNEFIGMSSEHEVVLKDKRYDLQLFRGRIYNDSDKLIPSRKYKCIGDLSYLNDTKLRPYATYKDEDTINWLSVNRRADQLFTWYIEQHNIYSDLGKQFVVRKNEGASFGDLTRASGQYPFVGNEIREKLTDSLGGYLFTDWENGQRVIDWTTEGLGKCSQAIMFGENLLDYATVKDALGIITAIIPRGKREVTLPDGSKEEQEFGVEAYADMELSDGFQKQGDRVIYIPAVTSYGIIEDVKIYEDITEEDELIKAAIRDISINSVILESVSISAIDLSILHSDIEPIRCGQMVRIIADPLGIDQWMMCAKIVYNIVNPGKSKYTFGSTRRSLVGGQSKRTKTMQSAVDNLVQAVPPLSQAAKDAAKNAAEAKEEVEGKSTTFSGVDFPDTNVTSYVINDTFVDENTGLKYIAITSREKPRESEHVLDVPPVPPYTVDQQYLDGDNEMWVCVIAKTEDEFYSPEDWEYLETILPPEQEQ